MVRRLGRTPSVLTAAVLVCLGVAIAGWSTQVATTADRLQIDRARASVGAATALTVAVPGDVPFVDAVRAADPDGRRAMAVDVFERGQGVGRLVAVDSSRLGAVSAWSSAWSDAGTPQRLASLLAPEVADSVELTGSSVSIDVDGVATAAPSGYSGDQFVTDLDDVSLRLVVQSADGWHTVDFGSPRDGTLTSVPGRFPCETGCRVVWFGATASRATTPPFGVQLRLAGISTDRQSAAELQPVLSEKRWHDRIGDDVDSQRPARATVTDAPDGGLALRLIDEQGANTSSIAPFDAPEPLPALVAQGTPVSPLAGVDDGIVGIGPDLSERALADVGHARILPRIGGEGVMVDLGMLERISDPAKSGASHEVWLAPLSKTEEARVVDDLARQGVQVVASRSLATVTEEYRRASTPRASSATVVVGAASLLLTLAATAALRIVSAPSRRRDREALEAAGVPRRRLRLLAALETFVPPAVGVVLGVGAGLLAYVATVSGLPLLVGVGRTPPPELAPAAWPLVAIGLGMLALVAGIAGVAARVEVPRDGVRRGARGSVGAGARGAGLARGDGRAGPGSGMHGTRRARRDPVRRRSHPRPPGGTP
ncbi:FtsX-like permease family protein [Frigoribacterium sp. 2-23]|uniref:FtsX-like permease family protein n=1 Tax=Frigoribacterium sp. 2-23 TaxID=3415006 RepID=UPI003C6F122D